MTEHNKIEFIDWPYAQWVVKDADLVTGRAEFKYWIHHLPTMGPYKSYLMFNSCKVKSTEDLD